MIFKLTTINCKLLPNNQIYIDQHLKKITQSLPDINEDLIVFRLNLKRNIDRYHPSRSHPLSHRSYSDIKPALAFFEGSINFRLDKKQLYVHFKGRTVNECLKQGFDLVFRELEKFKDLHFSSESEYSDHSSVRGKYA